MQNFVDVWTRLSVTQRVTLVGTVTAVFLAVLFLVRAPGQRDMSLLFGGLEASAAGEVLTALDQQDAIYEVRGGAIYVERAVRDSLRLVLAGQGLPVSGGTGYELLDNLSGFSTTSQMFDATYWRAKEGELARTIVSNPRFRSARVHISASTARPFQRNQVPSAAVNVQSTTGIISGSQVKALQFLVSSAVSGLTPDNVAVIDATAGLVSGSDELPGAAADNERADVLRARAERLLIARVGAGNAVVEVTMETVTDTETISERTVDPDSRVAISTDVQESAERSEDSRGGDVTVASNLPDGEAAGSGGNANNENSETRALTNFEVSETQREVRRSAGAVKRLTVAVLVNNTTVTNPDGTTSMVPRSTDELADLQELVSSAIGFDEARGDQITLRAMAFEPLPNLGTEMLADTIPGQPLDMMKLIQIGVLAAVALILGLFVVRPILTPRPEVAALPAPDLMGASGDLDDDDGPQMMSAFPDMMSIEGPDMGGMGFGDMPGAADDPVSRLQQMIGNRETETLQILEDWMDEPEKMEKV